MPERVSKDMPGGMPARMSERVPENMSEDVPERGSQKPQPPAPDGRQWDLICQNVRIYAR